MYEFSDLEEVEHCLRSMAGREAGALVVQLPHVPGTKEPRWAHLLSGQPDVSAESIEQPVRASSGGVEGRVAALESEVGRLREQLERVLAELGIAAGGH